MKKHNKKAMRKSLQTNRIAKPKESAERLTLIDSITDKPILSSVAEYERILSLIGAGEENAIHLSELVSITGLHNRELRKRIEQLRRSGTVIISSKKGYFRPLDNSEVSRYIKQEERRARSIFRTLKAARKLLKGDNE